MLLGPAKGGGRDPIACSDQANHNLRVVWGSFHFHCLLRDSLVPYRLKEVFRDFDRLRRGASSSERVTTNSMCKPACSVVHRLTSWCLKVVPCCQMRSAHVPQCGSKQFRRVRRRKAAGTGFAVRMQCDNGALFKVEQALDVFIPKISIRPCLPTVFTS